MAIRYCKRSVAVRALFEAAIACDVPMLIDGGGLELRQIMSINGATMYLRNALSKQKHPYWLH